MKLSKLFFWRASETHADINDVFARMDIRDKMKPDPDAHISVLQALGRYSLRSGHQYGPSHSFYSNPHQTVTIKSKSSGFLEDVNSANEQIRTSSNIQYTEESLGNNNRSFGLVINQSVNSITDSRAAMIFGLYGIYDKNGELSVKKLLAPGFDDNGTITKTTSITVTPENVELALLYAEHCAQCVYNDDPIMPYLSMNTAIERRDGYLKPNDIENDLTP